MPMGAYAHKGSYAARAVLDLTRTPTQAAAGARDHRTHWRRTMREASGEILPALPVHGMTRRTAGSYRLVVDGLVAQPMTFDEADLAALPFAEVTKDFVCQEGWCVPGLHWEGPALATVLAAVSADPAAACVQVSAGDFSTPLSREDASKAMLAMRLGSETLPVEHGGPVRLIVPGADCYVTVKWVDHVEVRTAPASDTAQAIARSRLER